MTKAIRAELAYPPEAYGATGKTAVAFRLSPEGIAPGTLVVRRSSGHALLDDEALRAVRAALSGLSPPPSLLGKGVTLELVS
jgi:protein TonB